ncbi:MAG: HlyC/CorC family transporter [Deltaproteobacteria bacterium]|nr:HlyC/CorC family transporter [Deltaproteobacteria bacterium]
MITELSWAIPLAVICVIGSAFCSGTEVALFSLRRVDREQLAHSTSVVDRQIIKLLERPRLLIASVLIGNEAFNSILAILCLGVLIPLCGPELSIWAVGGIALAVSLLLVVLFAEVTSKTLAAKAPTLWARICVIPLSWFMVLITPIRYVVQAVTSVLLAPFGDSVRNRPARDLAEDEFRSMIDAGAAQGQVDARERRLIHRVFEFSDKKVGEVMTPRERMFALSYDLPMTRLVKEVAARGFSRVPIYQKSVDNVRGILNAKDLVRIAAGQPSGKTLGELLHEPLFVPRTTPVKRLFLTFKQKKVHMAIVVSEYGKVLGVVTMDDVLAQIFGSFRDERAELQSSIPGRPKVRTPAPGVNTVPRAGTDPAAGGGVTETNPIPLIDPNDINDQSVPVSKMDGSDLSGPIPVGLGVTVEAAGVLDPPPAPRLIYPVDEVTPPAIDVSELLEQGEQSKEKKSS